MTKTGGAVNRKRYGGGAGAGLGRKWWVQFKVTTEYTSIENIEVRL